MLGRRENADSECNRHHLGVTLCLKDAIGIAQGKEFLPHRRPGTPAEGGDFFADYPSWCWVARLTIKRAVFSLIGGRNVAGIRSLVRRVIPAKPPHEVHTGPLYGDWQGKGTIWRTSLDLNLILFHADKSGLELASSERTYFGIIDGVIAMDHEAPMAGLPVGSRGLIAGLDPVATDTLGTYLMGFDPNQIPTIKGVCTPSCRFLGEGPCDSSAFVGNLPLAESRCEFVPTKGWAKLGEGR
ncbi:MAG: DUF362 domain-containing protein [Actinomycetota bacterium]|nr:DUF362 domain-containing protein [Actinomycetota bacterium]